VDKFCFVETMKKISTVAFFIIIIIAGIFVGTLVNSNTKTNDIANSYSPTKAQQLSPVNTSNPTKPQKSAEIIGIPQKISIPAINVDTSIEQVALDPQGNMDVPKTDYTVGWYKLGFKPGQKGSAVLSGHLDKKDASPAVFWKLSDLKAGDKIITTDVNGKSYTFTVTHLVEYPYDALPLNEIFAASDKANLNLITCKGNWNDTTKIYSHRLVVYSQRD
jgi:LPXTG-site transpeptidase (sortase) family protein